MNPPQSVLLSLLDAAPSLQKHAHFEPFRVDIDAVKVRFTNGEDVIVTQSFTQPEKFDLWLSSRDPYKPNHIVSSLSKPEADAWLNAISYRILNV